MWAVKRIDTSMLCLFYVPDFYWASFPRRSAFERSSKEWRGLAENVWNVAERNQSHKDVKELEIWCNFSASDTLLLFCFLPFLSPLILWAARSFQAFRRSFRKQWSKYRFLSTYFCFKMRIGMEGITLIALSCWSLSWSWGKVYWVLEHLWSVLLLPTREKQSL